MLTRADHVRRGYTTASGALQPGLSLAEYAAAYERALALDHSLGVDHSFAPPTIAELRAACGLGDRRRAPARGRRRERRPATAGRPGRAPEPR
jgi:hypothetical protein